VRLRNDPTASTSDNEPGCSQLLDSSLDGGPGKSAPIGDLSDRGQQRSRLQQAIP
jgi:hypothetical protein